MNQAGVSTEKLCFNFSVDRVHWASYAGKNFTNRQHIKRKAANWGKCYQALLMLFELLMAVLMERCTLIDIFFGIGSCASSTRRWCHRQKI
jgi:hypothetical protein